ncbi:MAG: CAP domain-containing protein [Acidimicrobiia bacterium]
MALHTTTIPRSWLLLVVGIVLAGLLVVLPGTTANAAVSPDEFEACLLEMINEARAEVGAVPLRMATDRIDQVRAWSRWMRYNEFRHMNSAERAPILPSGTYTWAENIAWTSNSNVPDCSQVHTMFMNSPGHRANILNKSQRFVALGAYVDGSGWWVTELFFASSSYDPACDGPFCDDDSSIFEAEIEQLAALGITSGCNPPTNDRFCPKSYVTRGQMAAFLVRALDLTDRGSVDFTDDNGSMFEADIERLAAAGITKGCNPPANTRFCPDSRVTRQSMAAFIVRALDLTERGSVDFTDDNGSVFEVDIERLATAGITRGCNPPANTRFCPTDYVSRETMAAFLVRALDHR